MKQSVVVQVRYGSRTLMPEGPHCLEYIHCCLHLAALDGSHTSTEHATPCHAITACVHVIECRVRGSNTAPSVTEYGMGWHF